MTTKDGYRGDRRPGLHLSPEVERYFQKAHPLLLGKLKGAAMGKSTPESRAFFKSCRELSAKLRPSSRNSDSKLAVPVSTGLVETVQYANKLSERLQRIKHTTGRGARKNVIVELELAYEIELWLLRRRIQALWRDIPRLIEDLGGNPAEDLMMYRKRVAR